MNVQLVDSLVEIVLKLTPEEKQLFQQRLIYQDLNRQTKKPLTPEERLKLWQEWIEKAPQSSVNLPDEALRRENIYDDRGA
ncbi:MAG: hypothetical protein ACK6A9_07305 [Dolichospermum sp.]|jgi:hypothetical protein|uniref:hypothetical protein n=1 Tax=Dolichospermum circinale TaxID=109265 RepID=UPI0023306451|nr:hypothetical protein [Dolichospermum circinale]MCE2719348.1 hypothetical protein [Anabaena sp. 49628_E55]MDB9453508.1 hypothetical protein [Dolichospermum circinale CS-541/06]MDB9463510.1 hypothetical protein [Dolichospermum circinale CS-541/04]MDB9491120.1 hypothetical protein [Dolichospermum circinale CS-534/05]MDB9546192.1 hypothetical protein [Dolichospermum circinale CS-1031]